MARNQVEFDEIFEAAKNSYVRAQPTLKAELQGNILFELQPGSQRFLINFKGSEPELQKLGKDESVEADCTLQMSFKTLMKILEGDLNPQLSLVGEKVKVKGKAGIAMYFFNLLLRGD